MKKIIVFIFVVLMSFNIISVLAADNVEVSAQETKLAKEQTVLVPIEVKNNTGLMGFKITVNYPAEVIDVVSVSRGIITKGGNFNTNLNVNDGKFDVLWNSTENISGDGSLFVLGIRALDYFSYKEITMSFSQEDTFNEKWEDVVLTCKPFGFSCIEGETITTTDVIQTVPNSSQQNVTLSPDQIVDMIQVTLEQLKYKSLDKVKDTEKLLNLLNENINKLTGDKFPYFDKFDDVTKFYADSYEANFITSVTDLLDAPDIKSAIEKSLDDFGYESMDDIEDKKVEKFVSSVEKNLKELNDEIPEISNDIDSEDSLIAIKKLYGSLATVESSSVVEYDNNYNLIIVIVGIVFLLALAAVLIVVNRKRHKGDE